MASTTAQKGLNYEPIKKNSDGRPERHVGNFWASLPPGFGGTDDFLHSRLTQTRRLDCLSSAWHAVDIGRGSRRNAHAGAPRIGGCGNLGAIHLLIVHRRWIVHANQCRLAVLRLE